ncbi:MAG: High-affinity branched-chain amino acid transport ATP-binding protein LivF [Holosporales bacterium]
MLSIQNLSVFGNFSKILAKNISFHINSAEIFCMLGVNGAGKTSIAKAMTGHLRCTANEILLNNDSLKGLNAHKIAQKRVAYVTEEKQIIQTLSVLEHLEIAQTVDSYFQDRVKMKAQLDDIYTLFPVLYERKKQQASLLSGGEQQMLCLAMALIKEPLLLILDEPSQGLSVKVVDQFFKILHSLKEKGLHILLIEQNLHHALSIADRGIVIQNGMIVLEGDGDFLKNHPELKRICLGID